MAQLKQRGAWMQRWAEARTEACRVLSFKTLLQGVVAILNGVLLRTVLLHSRAHAATWRCSVSDLLCCALQAALPTGSANRTTLRAGRQWTADRGQPLESDPCPHIDVSGLLVFPLAATTTHLQALHHSRLQQPPQQTIRVGAMGTGKHLCGWPCLKTGAKPHSPETNRSRHRHETSHATPLARSSSDAKLRLDFEQHQAP